MELSPWVVDQVKRGEAVLFLGSGASLECLDKSGGHPPSSIQLAKLLSDEFLGGGFAGYPLSSVAELAISESGLLPVQQFVKAKFDGFEPSEAHRKLPNFRWFGIATTNYDLLVEAAFDLDKSRVQRLTVLVDNEEDVLLKTKGAEILPYLKLHGCITRTSNPKCPLILTPDQYVQYKQGRDRLFTTFSEWAYEKTIIFVGSSLQDADLRATFLSLDELGSNRMRHYAVILSSAAAEKKFWEGRKITLVDGTFSELMTYLDQNIDSAFRKAIPARVGKHPISDYYTSGNLSVSDACETYLRYDATIVRGAKSADVIAPKDFYRGYSPGWAAIEQELDVRRSPVDQILEDHFLYPPATMRRLQLIVIRGHAGAGKTVILRRIAWEAAKSLDCLCLYVEELGRLDHSVIKEIVVNTNKRLFVFIDRIPDKTNDINQFIQRIGAEGQRITIIGAARTNEWNVSCESLEEAVTAEYDVKYLSEGEIRRLLDLLDRHDSLGSLKTLDLDERLRSLKVRAGRQLLVALHEATQGRELEKILEDEFNNIKPDEAQQLYLTICALNRLQVPVRAGLIARIHDLPFKEFRNRLFAPLEFVVRARKNDWLRDYTYEARHSHIASIVFDKVLKTEDDKFAVFMRVLSALNLDYQIDKQAFRKLTSANSLIETFTDPAKCRIVYDKAMEISGDDPVVLHQEAIYEMKRPGGNLTVALHLLKEASEARPSDSSIQHSFAELNLKFGLAARTPLERIGMMRAAKAAARNVIAAQPYSPYGYHTLARACVENLRLDIAESTADDVTMAEDVNEVEQVLRIGLEQFPRNPHLLQSESELAKILRDDARAMKALTKAFKNNPKHGFIALRLSRQLCDSGQVDEARCILESAIGASPGNRSLNFALASVLKTLNPGDHESICYFLKNSFVPSDRNFAAKIMYGRELFAAGRIEECDTFFAEQREMVGPGGAISWTPETVRQRIVYDWERTS